MTLITMLWGDTMQNKVDRTNILVVDTIAFSGGSKIATEHLLHELPEKDFKISVLSADIGTWKKRNPKIKVFRLFEFAFLAKKEMGIPYYLRHLWIALVVLITLLRTKNTQLIVGPSGPGVDLSIYLAQRLIKIPILQLIHGPVAASNTVARCLKRAQLLAYLPSTQASIIKALQVRFDSDYVHGFFNKESVFAMHNGLSKSAWPQASTNDFTSPKLFWGASLLKWKGLDLFLEASDELSKENGVSRVVCYILPKNCDQEMSEAPLSSDNLSAYMSPPNLDSIRADCNIFVSTSQHEPFGLSILEALAAGLCVLIPNDGAYWDNALTDNTHCIKYKAGSHENLKEKIIYLKNNMAKAKQIAQAGKIFSLNYQSSQTYRPILNAIESIKSTSAPHSHIKKPSSV